MKESELLRKKARKKFLSQSLAHGLVKLDSPLKKKYALTFGCASQMVIDGEQLLRSNFYCKNRWCSTCASINMAILIDKYKQPLSELQDVHFVTLTVPNIWEGEKLPELITKMIKIFARIQDNARKNYNIKFNGLRKLECKVSSRKGGYHPHFHILIEGAEAANFLVAQWLKRFEGTSIKGQDISKVEDLSDVLVEVMKYTTKLTCADNSGNEVVARPQHLDYIFRALYRRRIYQTFGSIKSVPEDVFEVNPEIIQKAQGIYNWVGDNWYHLDYGQALTDYQPDVEDLKIQHLYK